MGVRIDETRQGHQPGGVQACGVRGDADVLLQLLLRTDEDDPAVPPGDGSVLDQADVAKGRPALGDGAGAGQDLAAPGDDAVGLNHDGYLRTWLCFIRM